MIRNFGYGLLSLGIVASQGYRPAVAQTAPSAGAKNPSFNLVNKTEQTIRELYATPSGMENWGHSRLEGKTIAAGTTFPVRLRLDGNCIYDVRVVFTNGKVEERRRVDTCRADDLVIGGSAADAPTRSPAAAVSHAPSFRLVNRGKSPITEITATPADADKRGDNLLTDGATLAPQDAKTIEVSAPAGSCRFTLRVVFADKQSREKKDVDLCRTGDLPVQ